MEAVAPESRQGQLEKINVNDDGLRPSNYDKPDGKVLPLLQADGVRVDLSKRTRAPMNYWHRNMECDELIFCHKGGIRWETELGNITLGPGELFVIPKGIAHRSLLPETSDGENIIIELKIRGDVKKLI
jgi:homogentisate 1,2-dioxygenase